MAHPYPIYKAFSSLGLRWAYLYCLRGNDLMSGPSKLSLAIALALIGGNAFAVGLGSIQVKSGLNQPLDAEITVTTDSPAEASGLTVGLATAEDFQRVGLSRARVSVPIDFSMSTNGRGQPVIKLTTKDIVREPFLDFLVEVNWPKGKLLREYTVLLDPPVMAPVRGSSATVAPAREAAPAPAQKLVEERQPKPKPIAVKPPHAVAAETQPAPTPKPTPAPKPAPAAAPAHAAAAGDYGPVAQGETLSEVARATKPDDSTNVNQMMLALLKANPKAFYKDNINALKRGAILRIPSGDDVKASGSSMAAAAAVREQNAAWSGNAAVAKPTVVANAGAPKSSAAAKPETATGTKPSEHLALVPPRAGKDSQTTGDHPGPSTGTGTSAETKAELTRTKEALASREQEASELRSRVKQLEDLNGKDQRLLTLKESEIADLQNKLKQLQSSKAVVATPPPAATSKPTETPLASATKPAETAVKPTDAGAKTEPKLTAKDIWGDISASDKSTPAKPATPTTTAPAAATPIASTPAPNATPSATSPASSLTSAATTPATTPKPDATTPAATPPATTTASTPPPSVPSTVTTTPVITPPTSAPVSITANPPAVTPTVKPVTPPPATTPKPVAPLSADQPWYQNNMALLAGGLGLLLIGLLALMRFMRKPKPVLMPVAGSDEFDEHATEMVSEDEHNLLDALAQHPGDPHLSLELLSLYYAQHNATKFEAAAEAMYAHIADPTQPEWQQVRTMGEQLCPHNPLFGGSADLAGDAYTHDEHAHDDHAGFGHLGGDGHTHDDSFDLGTPDAHVAKASAEEGFDFDLTDHAAAAAAGAVMPAHEVDFSHEQTLVGPTPPPPAFQAPPAPAPVAPPAEDFFAGEDAIGTKLDLAKAYLDMGDPEGARSMLDEVMAEGNDAQKVEARKLLAEIR